MKTIQDLCPQDALEYDIINSGDSTRKNSKQNSSSRIDPRITNSWKLSDSAQICSYSDFFPLPESLIPKE